VGQGLRDHNLALAADRARLHTERRKLIFLSSDSLDEILASGEDRPAREAALFVTEMTPRGLALLAHREADGLASFVTSTAPIASLAHWRQVKLTD